MMMNRLVLERSWSLYRVKAHDLQIFLRKAIQVSGSLICVDNGYGPSLFL